jgi:hypothetical protein
VQNGLSVCRFNGTTRNDDLVVSIPMSSAVTLFWLGTPTTGKDDTYLVSGSGSGGRPAIISRYSVTVGGLGLRRDYAYFGGGGDSAVIATSASGFSVVAYTLVDGGSMFGYVNGTPTVTFTQSGAISGTSITRLGSANTAYANADMGELLVWNRALSGAERQQVEAYLSRKWSVIVAKPPTVTNADAQSWIDRVYANGGTVSTSTAAAVNTFCNDIDAAGIRDRFLRLNLFAGSSLSAALVPLYRATSLTATQLGNTTDTNFNFVSGDYVETGSGGGLKGNGTNKYLNTGVSGNAATFGNSHLSGYVCAAPTSGTFAGIVSAYVNNGDELSLVLNQTPTSSPPFFAEENTATGFVAATTSNPTGHILGASVSSTDRRMYLNGTQNGSTVTNALTKTQYTSQALLVMARHNSGTPSFFNSGRLGAYSIGRGFTDSQASAYYTAMQAFQTALSRNV